MDVRDLTVGAVFDAVRWAREAYHAAAKTPAGSAERDRKLADLERAAARARELIQERDDVPETYVAALRFVESGISDLRRGDGSSRGRYT